MPKLTIPEAQDAADEFMESVPKQSPDVAGSTKGDIDHRAAHTPGPWGIGDGPEIYSVPRQQSVAMVLANGDGEANAAFIVRACNAYDDLLAALREAETALAFATGFICAPGHDISIAAGHELVCRHVRAAIERATSP